MKLNAPIEGTALTSPQDINQKLQFFGIFHGKPSLTSPALTTLTSATAFKNSKLPSVCLTISPYRAALT